MSRAEERALEAYPYDYPERTGFRQGYEQAKKDFELTWEDMVIIHSICADVYDSHRYEWDSKQIYEEVLRRFNKAKKEKEMSNIENI